MTLTKEIVVLYLEANLVLNYPVSQVAMAQYMGVGRQNMSYQFVYWKEISTLPFYDKNAKEWIKAKCSQSVLFRSKAAAEEYMAHFDAVFTRAKKLRSRQNRIKNDYKI